MSKKRLKDLELEFEVKVSGNCGKGFVCFSDDDEIKARQEIALLKPASRSKAIIVRIVSVDMSRRS